ILRSQDIGLVSEQHPFEIVKMSLYEAMEITHLSSDDTYDADMIDKRIFVGEPHDDKIFNRFFRKKDLKKLY
ncbi:3393_t:CDS:2, partial [Gigaspora margarita]